MGHERSITHFLSSTKICLCCGIWTLSLLVLASAAPGQDADPATGSQVQPTEKTAGSQAQPAEKTVGGLESTAEETLGKETEPAEFPLAEPKALLAPAKLIPVEAAPAAPVAGEVAPASAPPIRLAPEPLPLNAEPAKQITNDVEGIRPASFKDITPGESTRENLIGKLGEPLETTAREGQEELVFKLGPFPWVRITVTDSIVSSIVIRLAGPTARGDVVKELNLADFEPVTIRDDADRALGEVYPERGLMFAYQGDAAADGEPRIGQVVLERISVEPFLLRVEQTPEDQITQQVETLRIVQQLLPDDAEAFAITARLDQKCGRLETARDAAQKALDIDTEKSEYRILLADINRQLGHHREALQSIRAALSDDSLSSLEKARARYVLGRLLAATPNYDYKQAMQETVTAIKLAAAEANTQKKAARRRAQRLLVRAELSLAEILSYGPWKQRHAVVPQWLASAEKAANDHIDKDGASRDILLDLYRTSLHCLLVLDGQGSSTKIADAAIQLGRGLIADSEDLDYQSLVEWKLGTGLWYAAQIEQQQGHTDEALRLANNAEALMSASGQLRGESPETVHHLAQLRFLLGSIHAVYKRDDATATYWYDKTMPQLTGTYPDSFLDDRGLIGEQLVSVGISLWETGRRNKALSVTQQGATLIDDAVKAGSFKRSALAVPYQNLAAMHRELGNETEAEKMAQKAAQYEPGSSTPQVRR